MGCGGCVATTFFILLVFMIFRSVAEGGKTAGLILLAIVVGVYVIWQFRDKPTVRQAEVTPQNYEWLGLEVKAMFVDLSVPVKNELRKSRGASGYEDIFTMDFFYLICRFAALDGTIHASEGKVFLDIFKVLQPIKYGGLLAEDGAALLEGHRQRHPETLQVPILKSLLFTLTQQVGEPFVGKLKELMYKVALQVALADGPLSPIENAELEALRSGPGAKEQLHEGDHVLMPNANAATATPGLVDEIATAPAEQLGQHPIIEPQFTCATGLVTIDILKEKTKELIELLEPLLKVELRKTQQSSMARDLVEQDIRAIIARGGFTNGSVSPYAAHLYLEIFKYLHPRIYAGWTVDSTLSFFQQIIEKNRETYLGVLKKPYTLEVAERLDVAHGTGITKPTRDIFLIIAFFAASADGKVSEAKAAEIGRMKAIFEATA